MKTIICTNNYEINNKRAIYKNVNEYLEVNMIPGNPKLFFYEMHYTDTEPPKVGEPLYYNSILYGICSKTVTTKKIVYVLPILYILKSIENKNNNLLFCKDINKIKSIDKYKVKNNKIYFPQFGKYVNIESYTLYISNNEEIKKYINDNKNKIIQFEKKIKYYKKYLFTTLV